MQFITATGARYGETIYINPYKITFMFTLQEEHEGLPAGKTIIGVAGVEFGVNEDIVDILARIP